MVDDCENIARLLFSDYMVTHLTGQLTAASFPTEELLEKPGKDGQPRSVSVDRCNKIDPLNETLEEKARVFENPDKDRVGWGFAVCEVAEVRGIFSSDKKQVYDVFPDPIFGGSHPKWDQAHAKLVRASSSHSRSLVRGSRDKLVELFQANLHQFGVAYP